MLQQAASQGLPDRFAEHSPPETPSDSVGMYLREIGRLPLLTAEEEELLGSQLRHGNKNEAQEARRRLIEGDLQLVVSIAKNYIGRGLPLMGLIQEGNLGLMRTINKFDHRKGYRFSTYASWWIHEQITRAIARQTRTIHITALALLAINRLLYAGHVLAERFEMQAPPEDIDQLAKEIGQFTSPDATVCGQGDGYLSGVSYHAGPQQGYWEVAHVGRDRVQRGST